MASTNPQAAAAYTDAKSAVAAATTTPVDDLYPQANASYDGVAYFYPHITETKISKVNVVLVSATPVKFANKDPITFFLDTSLLSIGSTNPYTVRELKIVASHGTLSQEYRVNAFQLAKSDDYSPNAARMKPLNRSPAAFSSTHTLGPCAAVVRFGESTEHNLLPKDDAIFAESPALASSTGINSTSLKFFVNVNKADITAGVTPFTVDKKEREPDSRRIIYTIHRAQDDFVAQPVAWLLLRNMKNIIAANPDDKQRIFVHNEDSIIVKTCIYDQYLAEVERLVDAANREIRGFICIEAVPDMHSMHPSFPRTHGMNPAVADESTRVNHYPRLDIEITVSHYSIQKTQWSKQTTA